MFWRKDWLTIDNEKPLVSQQKPVDDSRFVLREQRRKHPSEYASLLKVAQARKLLEDLRVHELVNMNFAAPIKTEKLEPVEQPSGLPDIFSPAARRKLPILEEF